MNEDRKMSTIKSSKELQELYKKLSEKRKGARFISISSGTCGQARGSLKIVDAFRKAAKDESVTEQFSNILFLI